jgi:hypothetical protein
MRIRVSFAIALIALLALPGLLFAQSTPATTKPAAISVTIVYHENNSGMFDIRDDKGASLGDPTDGDELKLGWTVVSGKGDLAELKLNHTSTIIKVSGNTNFTLSSLRTDKGGQDVFSLAIGKIRTVAGKASTKDLYQIKTQSAVCGVRGSDIVVESLDGINATESTLEGTGWLQNAAGQALDLAQGFEADTAAATFQAVQIPADVLQALQNDMKFTKLNPADTLAVAKAYAASLTQPAPAQPAEKPAENAPQSNPAIDNMLAMLRDILGFEMGSINVPGPNGETLTYAQAVFEPTFTLGKLKIALYLPIIYQSDMFNMSDWYRPSGNNEWSFGQDQHGITNQAADAARDLLLKIKFIEYGRQRDPFFLKLGNLDDITIGHGLIMQNFANDADFPAVRHVGLNFGVDGAGGGFEFMANDIAPDVFNGTLNPPDIMGTRLYMRLLGRAAIGVSGVVDLNPARDYPGGPDMAGNPVFFNPGVDLDIPFVETDALGLILFADGALMMPYLRTAPTGFPSLKPGLQTAAFYDKSAQIPVKNWGAATGIFGNLITPDFTYKLQYQLYTGNFQPQFYDSAYERNRAQFVLGTLDYLANGAANLNTYYMGIYGQAGFKIGKFVTFNAGYFWPWDYDATSRTLTYNPSDDHFLMALQVGQLPIIPISGGFSYERSGFVYTLQHGGVSGALFDAQTVVTANVSYAVSPIMDVTLLYTVIAARDGFGNLIYVPGSLLPETNTSVSVQTQIHL